MKTAARVLTVTDDRARLGCDSIMETCTACGGGCMLRRLAPGREASLEVSRLDENGVPLEPGARVTIEVGSRDLLAAAFRAALLPLAGALGGPLIFRAFVGAPAASDAGTVLAALLGLLAGWMAARQWLRHAPPRVAVWSDVPRAVRESGEGGR
jgi:positive regulator of sigma E activity